MLAADWIYNFADFQHMYDLTPEDLSKRILDFPGVIGSFNAEATEKGGTVTSAGPIFQMSEAKMQAYANRMLDTSVAKLQAMPERLKETSRETVQRVISQWEKATASFLQDYAAGKEVGRYLSVDLSDLPFKTHQFDLALCSHLLFHEVLPENVSVIDLLHQLCDIAQEVRLYPLLDAQGKITDELGPLMLALQQENYGVEIREVAYDMQRGGNAMLRIWAQACVVSE